LFDGQRLELESRYAFQEGDIQVNFYRLSDEKFTKFLTDNQLDLFPNHRLAIALNQKQTFLGSIKEKLRINEVSDVSYVSEPDFEQDLNWKNDSVLSSELNFQWENSDWNIDLNAKRFRTVMPELTDPRLSDAQTVQLMPQLLIRSKDQLFWTQNVAARVDMDLSHFYRLSGGGWDRDLLTASTSSDPFRQGIDPIREAVRLTLNPSVYTTFRAWDRIKLVPSLEYKQYFYAFKGLAEPLVRGYPRAQLESSVQFERVFESEDSTLKAIKHVVRPQLTYSLIPMVIQPGGHPFIDQMEYARVNQVSGYNFDNEDIIPLDTTQSNVNYFTPLGHSLAYGITTQLIERDTNPQSKEKTYHTFLDWSLGQSYNFRALREEESSKQPFSRFYSLMSFGWNRWNSFLDYYYTPYLETTDETSRHVYSTGLEYAFIKKLENQLLTFERKVFLNYQHQRSSLQSLYENIKVGVTYSVSDYLIPQVVMTFNLVNRRWQEVITQLTYQSPSECWKLDVGYSQSTFGLSKTDPDGWDGTVTFNLQLNLAGNDFGNLSQAASKTINQISKQ
jgi:hypothetical protein